MGGEDDPGTGRHVLFRVDEDRAARLEILHHMSVVDDLLANVDRSAPESERLLDRRDGTLHTGAIATGRSQDHAFYHRQNLDTRDHVYITLRG